MWGRFVLDEGILSETTVSGVKLLRAAASIQVEKGAASTANGLNYFNFQTISTYQASVSGFLVPENFTEIASTPTTANPFPDSEYMDYNHPEKSYITI